MRPRNPARRGAYYLASMRILPLIALFSLAAAGPAAAQAAAQAATRPAAAPARRPALPAVPFGPGERLDFAVEYGVVPAGTMTIRVDDLVTYSGRQAYHIVFSARSNSAVSFLYELNTAEESWFDAREFYSLAYTRRSTENDETRNRSYRFDQQRRLRITANGESQPASPRAVDQLAMMYYIRMLPLKPGASFRLQNQADPDDNPLTIKVLKQERIRVPGGTFDTYVLQLDVRTDSGVFRKGGDNRVWITTDARRLPVKLTSKIGLGNFEASLVDYTRGRALD
ncbi:MAG: DUF3108 domain-containing protein [Gemmatimonadota bacterium]